MTLTGWTYGVQETTTNTTCKKWLPNKPKTDPANCKTWNTKTTQSPDKKAAQTYVGNFGSSNGLGVEKTSAENHTADNEKGYFDMFLLSFSEMVSLDSINLGYIHNDSDISILAFDGDLSQVSPLGKSWESLLGAGGWTSAGNYYDVAKNAVTGVNPLNITSQYWLIGAYNPLLDTFTKDTKSDYIKLKSITVSKVAKVPEPSAMFLFGLGLLGLVVARRRTV